MWNKKIAHKLLPIHGAVACLPYERIEHAFIFSFFFFRELFRPTPPRARSRHSVGHSQWSPTGSSTTCSRGRPCAHVRPRSTRWHLRWIWRCFAPREPYFWPSVYYGVLPLPSAPLHIPLPLPPFPLAHPYRRSRSREAPV